MDDGLEVAVESGERGDGGTAVGDDIIVLDGCEHGYGGGELGRGGGQRDVRSRCFLVMMKARWKM